MLYTIDPCHYAGRMVPTFLRQLWFQPYLLLTLTSLFWAGNVVVGRAIVGAVPPFMLAQLRWTAAFLIIVFVGWREVRRNWPVIRQNLPIMLLLSFLGVTAFNTLLYWGLQHTTAINATLVQVSGPLLIGVWGLILFRDVLTRLQIIGIAISAIGVIIIVTDGDLSCLLSFRINIGDLAILTATALYALYAALLRLRPKISALAFLTFSVGTGAVFLMPFTLAETVFVGSTISLNPPVLLAIAYIVVFPSLAAYFFFNRGVELIGANRAGPFFYLIPLFGSILAITFLGEAFTVASAVSAALILAGVVVATRTKRPAAVEILETRKNRVERGSGPD